MALTILLYRYILIVTRSAIIIFKLILVPNLKVFFFFALCYGPYQTSVTTTQSGAWGVGGRGTGPDGTHWAMWRRMVNEVTW